MNKKLRKTLAVLLILALLFPTGALAVEMEDVSADDWFYPYVMRGLDFGLITGTSNDSFRFEPNRPVTRAEFVTMLGRLHEHRLYWEGNSIDTPADGTFYGRYLAWAVEYGIIHGNQHGDLMPRALITREQMAVIVYRYIDMFDLRWNLLRPPASDEDFDDFQDVSNWARTEVWDVVLGYGLMEGVREQSNLVFRPQANSSRTEALTVLVRLGEQLVQLLLCSGCGDIRSFGIPSFDANFVDNVVMIGLTRCVSQRDKRDWTPDDFDNIDGILYVRDLWRLSDREWELIQDGKWPEFRRMMVLRLDQNCKENVVNVVQQLQQHEFIRWASPGYLPTVG